MIMPIGFRYTRIAANGIRTNFTPGFDLISRAAHARLQLLYYLCLIGMYEHLLENLSVTLYCTF